MYSSLSSSVDKKFVDAVEPLLLDNKVITTLIFKQALTAA